MVWKCRIWGILSLGLVLLGMLGMARPQNQENQTPLPEVNIRWGEKIPMRDGIKLQATVYEPANRSESLPVILSITPYMADNFHERALYFAENGYIFVIVDSRGRGNSEGEFEPFANEGKDGHDVVEWIARQPWCKGRVGMYGGSYGGFNQWATLKEFPPHLKTIVPVASAHPGVDLPAPQGIFDLYMFRWITLTSGKNLNQKLFGDDAFWIAKYRERYLKHRPVREFDQIVGNPNPHFLKWLKHRRPDAYWDAMVPSKEDYAKIDIPILSITGHYDSDQLGAMEYYHRHMRHGTPKAKSRHYLIMGPWDHGGTRTPKEDIGGVTFGKASLVDMNQLHKSWYDWTLKEGLRPLVLNRRVLYFVGGLERWKQVPSLEVIPTQPHKWYLHSSGKADDVFHSGSLRIKKPRPDCPADTYQYDPLETRPAELQKEKIEDFLVDQRHPLNLFGQGLVYHSEPLTESMEITGYMKFISWIKLNVPDTDFQVDVYEVQPDGKSIFLSQDRLRARHCDSFREEKLVKPGEILRYEFKNFAFISRLVQKGSRLRLVFSSPNSIYVEKNYNSGGVVEAETRNDAQTAKITLYHDEDHPSYLELPAIKMIGEG